MLNAFVAAKLPSIRVEYAYAPISDTSTKMLDWPDCRSHGQMQRLSYGLARVGTIGDGNCLLHSFLFTLSPVYRVQAAEVRAALADAFRAYLRTRMDRLAAIADAYYADSGGRAVISEPLEDLMEDRTELSLEIAPIIARMFGVNLVAFRVGKGGVLEPACLSLTKFNPDKPTMLLNYYGGALDIGAAARAYKEGGHYEAIVSAPPVSKSSSSSSESRGVGSSVRKTRKSKPKAKKPAEPVMLPPETKYLFAADDISELLVDFVAYCSVDPNLYVSPPKSASG